MFRSFLKLVSSNFSTFPLIQDCNQTAPWWLDANEKMPMADFKQGSFILFVHWRYLLLFAILQECAM